MVFVGFYGFLTGVGIQHFLPKQDQELEQKLNLAEYNGVESESKNSDFDHLCTGCDKIFV